MLRQRNLLPALLLLSCGRSAPGHSLPSAAPAVDSAKPRPVASAVNPLATIATENERLRLGQVSEAEMRAALKRRLAEMQAALHRNDAAAFAAAVVYPAYVNTSSSCSAIVPDQEAFRLRFPSIVDSAIRKALLNTEEASAWGGTAISVAEDRIWFPVGGRGFVFNTGELWSLPGLACWEETPRDVPPEFPHTWLTTNVCWAEDEPRRASFITRSQRMRFEPRSGSVTFTSPDGASVSCHLDRVSDNFIGRSPMSLDHCGPESDGLTLSLDCRKAGESYVIWMIYTGGILRVQGANNVVVTLEPAVLKR